MRTAISPRFATRSLRIGTPELYGEPMAGPLWGLESDELNATLLEWGPGEGPPEETVNTERDVLVFVHEGSLTLFLDGVESEVPAGRAVIVEKGRRRRLVAGPEGVRYLTAHRRRGGLQIRSRG
jgi:quercetin dioxygenase-like cupin family protein